MKREQDPQITQLIEQTLPLVKHIVFQVSVRFPRHTDREELAQAGVIGLVQAAHRYDASRGVPFQHFAGRRIRGAILDAVRNLDWAPRSVRRAGRSIEAITDALANNLGRSPTSPEVAAGLGISPETLTGQQGQLVRSVVLALDMAVLNADGDGDGDGDMMLTGALGDASLTPVEEELEHRELNRYLHDAVDLLPERHRIIIQGYFFEGRTSKELARELGVTVSRISQLRSEAFAMLRDGIQAQYRAVDVDSPAPVPDSARMIHQRGAYATAIAAQSTWRSRLDAAPARAGGRLG